LGSECLVCGGLRREKIVSYHRKREGLFESGKQPVLKSKEKNPQLGLQEEQLVPLFCTFSAVKRGENDKIS